MDEGSFVRAADRLGISASAMTQQIKKLERTAGIRLVDRSPLGLSLTKPGLEFLEHASSALESAQSAMEVAFNHASLKVGFLNGSALNPDMPFLSTFRAEHPAVVLEFVQLAWGEQIDALHDKKVDVLIGRPPYHDERGISSLRIGTEARMVAVATNSPLALLQTVQIADLAGYPVVEMDGVHDLWNKWWAIDPRPDGTPVRYGPSVTTMGEAWTVVSTTDAIMLTTKSAAEAFRLPGIRYLPILDASNSQFDLCSLKADVRKPIVELRRHASQQSY